MLVVYVLIHDTLVGTTTLYRTVVSSSTNQTACPTSTTLSQNYVLTLDVRDILWWTKCPSPDTWCVHTEPRCSATKLWSHRL